MRGHAVKPAGFRLARIMGDYFRRPPFGIAAWSMALVLGMVQPNQLTGPAGYRER